MKINELSTEYLAKYKKAAGVDATNSDKDGNTDQANKRFRGIVNATKKQFDNDSKKYTKDTAKK